MPVRSGDIQFSADQANTWLATKSLDDIPEGATYKRLTAAEKTKIADSVTAAGALSAVAADGYIKAAGVAAAGAFMKGTDTADSVPDGTSNKAYTAAEKTKLTGIATAAVDAAGALSAVAADGYIKAAGVAAAGAFMKGTDTADSVPDGTSNKAYTATEKTKLTGVATAAVDAAGALAAVAGDGYIKAAGVAAAGAFMKGTDTADAVPDGTTNKAYTATEKTKLTGIATAAVDAAGALAAVAGDGYIKAAGALTAAAPRHPTAWHDEDTIISGASMITYLDVSQIFATFSAQSVGVDGDSFGQEIVLDAGTYTLYTRGVTADNRGKIDWYLDAVKIVSLQDWYSAGQTYNVLKSTASIVVAGGRYTFKGVINGKHASSSGYAHALTKSWFVRTGA